MSTDIKVGAVVAHYIQREQIFCWIDWLVTTFYKPLRNLFSRSAQIVVADEELGGSRRDGSVLEHPIGHRVLGNPRGHQYRGHAYAQAIELELHAGSRVIGGSDVSVRRTGGWGDMVVNAAVFVVGDEESCGFPEIVVLFDGVI